MEKIWYIKIENQIEGPFSVKDLKCDRRITPDTLVFRNGFDQWVPMRHVSELKEVFSDEKEPSAASEDEKEEGVIVPQDEMVLHLQNNYSPFLFLILILILVFYIFYNLQLSR